MARRILVFGATSLVGSHFVTHPPQGSVIEAAGRSDPRPSGLDVERFTKVDLNDEAAVRNLLKSSRVEACVNFAARTDVDACETERPMEAPAPNVSGLPSSAWRVNAEFPRWLAEESAGLGRYLVQVSTDAVFDGTAGPYGERTPPHPFGPKLSWYGYTKGVGEAAVFSSKGPRSILRVTHPYRPYYEGKTDLARTILTRARAGALFPLYTDQIITPTWVPDVTDALGALIEGSTSGVFHVASPEITTPYEFAQALLNAVGLPSESMPRGRLSLEPSSTGRAPRPLHGGLRVLEIHKLDVRPISYREGARRMVEEALPAR